MRRRERAERDSSRLYRVVRALFGLPVRLIGRVRVYGAENEPPPGAGCLVVCNHLTNADPLCLCAALRRRQPRFMAKRELFRIPLLGRFLRAMGAYPVDRSGADVGAVRRTIALLKSGRAAVMFPQGHRRNGLDPRATPIRPGIALVAVRAGVPILPVFFRAKDHRARFLRRRDVIIGRPIPIEDFRYDAGAPGEFRRVAAEIFERVCALGDGQP